MMKLLDTTLYIKSSVTIKLGRGTSNYLWSYMLNRKFLLQNLHSFEKGRVSFDDTSKSKGFILIPSLNMYGGRFGTRTTFPFSVFKSDY